VVGWSYTPDNARTTAFLFDGTPGVDGLVIDLDAWLDDNNPIDGAKWTLTEATGISNTGWITGVGTYDPDGPGGITGMPTGFLLDASTLVPEPSVMLIAFCGITLLRSRHACPVIKERCRMHAGVFLLPTSH
jgi:hypothetical protein